MQELLINSVFELQGRRYRFLGSFEKPEASVVVIETDRPNVRPERWILSRRNPSTDSTFKCVADVPLERPHTESQTDVENGRHAYECIKGLLNKKGIFDGTVRASLLRHHAAELRNSLDLRDGEPIRVCPKTLMRWLIKHWQGGGVLAALYTNLYRSGYVDENTEGALKFEQSTEDGKHNVYSVPEGREPRGRKPRHGKKHKWEPGERRRVISRAWTHLAADHSKSIHGARVAILAELYTLKDEFGVPLFDDRGRAVLKEGIPSHRQIEYACSKVFAKSHLYKHRHGRHEYANNVKPRNGSVKQDAIGPGDVYEVDATTMDIWLVDRKTRKTVIGKPTLYLVIDRWSRLIVGFHVSLENPSWSEAKLAIANLCEDWQELGRKLGVKVLDTDLVAKHRWPNRFFADRSEFITAASELLCEGLLTQVTNAKAKMPADKPIVESGFLTLQARLRQFAKGYEPPENYMKRRGKVYFRDARWDINELRDAVLRIILFHNRTWKPGYEQSTGEIWLGLSLSPIEIFKRGIKGRMGKGSTLNRNLVLSKLCPRATALLTSQGIHWANCWYEIPNLKEWQVRAKLNGSIEVDISYTTSSVSSIVVHDPYDRRKSYPAVLMEKSKKWATYSKAERHAAWRREVDSAKGGDRERIQHEVALYLHLMAINEVAEEATSLAIKGVKPGTRKRKGVKARQDEMLGEREDLHDIAKYYEGQDSSNAKAESEPDTEQPQQDDVAAESETSAPVSKDFSVDASMSVSSSMRDLVSIDAEEDPYFRPQRGT